jgi:hypothetical protein
MSADKKPTGPWTPAGYDVIDVQAIQALVRGDATSDQQQRALRWIVEQAAGTYDQSFWPGGEDGRRNTDFSEGRRFVGNQIVKLTKLNVSSLIGRKGNA